VPATSPTTSPASRAAADRCPGALRLIEAADGFLARVRLPGGFVTGEQLRALAGLATELGDGRIELTSRGNVQLRALAADAAEPLTAALTRAGLLPSLDHDRVRNVLASPLAGLDGLGSGRDLTAIVAALDAELCARPRLAELSGRFLFAIDDGRGDVAGPGSDVVAAVRANGIVVNGLAVNGVAVDRLAVSGLAVSGPVGDAPVPDSGAAAASADVVTVMLAFAEAFLDERATSDDRAWHIADLPDGGAERLCTVVAEWFALAAAPESADHRRVDSGPAVRRSAARPVGIVSYRAGSGGGTAPRSDGVPGYQVESGCGEESRSVTPAGLDSVVLLAPLGRLTAAQVTWLAARVAGRPARITPWRSVVLPDQPDADAALREAADLGFGVDDGSPWLRVTACAGRPGCASALADVQADAAAFAARWPGRIVHVSGCGRHCGRPAATEIDVTATSEGYDVAGV
jgi:precorrin-3B synthase